MSFALFILQTLRVSCSVFVGGMLFGQGMSFLNNIGGQGLSMFNRLGIQGMGMLNNLKEQGMYVLSISFLIEKGRADVERRREDVA